MSLESLDFTKSNKPESADSVSKEFDAAVEHFLKEFSDLPFEEMDDKQREIAEVVKNYFDQKFPNRTLH